MTPIYPLAKTVANINMDSWNVHGRTKDLTLIGYGASDLDDYARDAAAEQGRVVHGDAEPEKGFYYRSDHFNFAKQGVPALDPDERRRLHRQAGRTTARRCATSGPSTATTRRGTSCMPDWDLERRARGSEGVVRGRLPRRAGGQDSGVEARQRVQGEARGDAEADSHDAVRD